MLNNLLAKPWLNLLVTEPTMVKVIVFLLAWMVIWLPLAIPLAIILKLRLKEPLQIEQKIPLIASLYLIAPLIIWVAISIEGNSWASCGINLELPFLWWFILGLLLAILGIFLLYALESSLDWLQWQPQNFSKLTTTALPLLGLSMVISIVEELVFRGWMISELAVDHTYWIAATIGSVIFALSHLVWERQKTLPQLPGLWLMGMVLAQARLATQGSVALAWGLHAGWIWALTSLHSAELIIYSDRASPWFIGFSREPLAGLVGIGLMLATGAICYSII
ncbi:CPBP family intramembrane glutamic endopeptidase [Gloeocapsa sp. PCC 73106]|uniref:CPBP family intramembrane glutamic endopeptidase n=1 Tax=Gloeocapsa sp. PCC 73106 TaxID=102232 RepID=UPI0002AC65A0|nr:CPBP family intramembrane glutamic endopeptidase [Gloeocapsa sp. PCC 73106]ELR99643.1 CAAX amino terminal protease family [Gloeocapsa sp. PCC 73106]